MLNSISLAIPNKWKAIATLPRRTAKRLKKLLQGPVVRRQKSQPAYAKNVCERSLVRRGDPTRLLRTFEAAHHGREVRIGMIGGSITQGGNASQRALRYADLVKDWWQGTFPVAKFDYVNAGIGGTASNLGSHRAFDDLLHAKPDFVIIEFAVNDENTEEYGITMEGLIRQVLKQPQKPAVMLLSHMRNDGSNAQDWHGPLCQHYDLTMVSVRDALWPEIAAGRLLWSDVIDDHIHPNDAGHRASADFVIRYLDSVVDEYMKMPQRGLREALNKKIESAVIPAPLYNNTYEFARYQHARDSKPLHHTGWHQAKTSWDELCWETTTPGSVLEYEFEGTSVHLMYHRLRSDFGLAHVQIDDNPPMVVDGWFSGDWGGINFCLPIAHVLPPGKHRMKITLAGDKHAESTGHRFQVIAAMSAGQ